MNHKRQEKKPWIEIRHHRKIWNMRVLNHHTLHANFQAASKWRNQWIKVGQTNACWVWWFEISKCQGHDNSRVHYVKKKSHYKKSLSGVCTYIGQWLGHVGFVKECVKNWGVFFLCRLCSYNHERLSIEGVTM